MPHEIGHHAGRANYLDRERPAINVLRRALRLFRLVAASESNHDE
jgi:hypothetical protein